MSDTEILSREEFADFWLDPTDFTPQQIHATIEALHDALVKGERARGLVSKLHEYRTADEEGMLDEDGRDEWDAVADENHLAREAADAAIAALREKGWVS